MIQPALRGRILVERLSASLGRLLVLAMPLHPILPRVHGNTHLDHVLRFFCRSAQDNRVIEENMELALVSKLLPKAPAHVE